MILNRMPSEVVSVVEAWEIIYFSILSASLLRIKNSMGLLTRSAYFVLRCRIIRDDFITSFPRTTAQMTLRSWQLVSVRVLYEAKYEIAVHVLTSECKPFLLCAGSFPLLLENAL